MTEFGIFTREGLLEGQFYSHDEARQALASRYTDEDDAVVAEVCTEHEDQQAGSCEPCTTEEPDPEAEAAAEAAAVGLANPGVEPLRVFQRAQLAAHRVRMAAIAEAKRAYSRDSDPDQCVLLATMRAATAEYEAACARAEAELDAVRREWNGPWLFGEMYRTRPATVTP